MPVTIVHMRYVIHVQEPIVKDGQYARYVLKKNKIEKIHKIDKQM